MRTTNRTLTWTSLLLLASAAATLPAAADPPREYPRRVIANPAPPPPSSSLRFGLGLFSPDGDSDFWDDTARQFTGDVDDLEDLSFSFDYRLPIGRTTDVQFGLELLYGDTTRGSSEPGFSDVLHEAELSIVPLTVGVAWHPFGRYGTIAPYVSAGAGFYLWEYEELGEFVFFDEFGQPDFIDFAEFRSDGVSAGYYLAAGASIELTPTLALFGEAKWHDADDDLGDQFAGLGEIDLSGTNFTVGLAWSL